MTQFPRSNHMANNAICVLSRMLRMASDEGERLKLRKLRTREVVSRNLAMTETQANTIASRMKGKPSTKQEYEHNLKLCPSHESK